MKHKGVIYKSGRFEVMCVEDATGKSFQGVVISGPTGIIGDVDYFESCYFNVDGIPSECYPNTTYKKGQRYTGEWETSTGKIKGVILCTKDSPPASSTFRGVALEHTQQSCIGNFHETWSKSKFSKKVDFEVKKGRIYQSEVSKTIAVCIDTKGRQACFWSPFVCRDPLCRGGGDKRGIRNY